MGAVAELLQVRPDELIALQYLLVVRVLRLLRIFRILKLAEYLHEGQTLGRALFASRRKISVFLLTVVTVVIIVGALMYEEPLPDALYVAGGPASRVPAPPSGHATPGRGSASGGEWRPRSSHEVRPWSPTR